MYRSTERWRFTFFGWVLLSCLPMFGANTGKRILLFYPYAPSRPATIATVQGAQSVFSKTHPLHIEIIPEHVLGQPGEVLWLAPKYAGQSVDLIICATDAPLQTALQFRKQRQQSIPILLLTIQSDTETAPLAIDQLYWMRFDFRQIETIRTAMAVLPATENIVVVGGATPENVRAGHALVKQLHALWPERNVIQLTGLTLEETRQRAAQLPPHSICLLGDFDADAEGLSISKQALVQALSSTAAGPIFDGIDVGFDYGIAGGWINSMERVGIEAGRQAIRILNGETPESIGVGHITPGAYRFDDRQLRRWKIDRRNLPKGSSIEFAEPTFARRYRSQILLATGAAATLVLLLLFLLVERWRRERSHSEFKQRAGFDAILGKAVRSLGYRSSMQADQTIQEMMHNLREHLHADFAALLVTRSAGEQTIQQEFRSPEENHVPLAQEFPFIVQRVFDGHEITVPDQNELFPAASADASSLQRRKLISLFAAPVSIRGNVAGAIVVGVATQREWSRELVDRVRQIGQAAKEVWGRHAAVGETLAQSIVGSFEGYVLALDRSGRVLHANSSPLVTQDGEGFRPPLPGGTYDTIWRGLPTVPAEVLESVRQVIEGDRPDAHEVVRLDMESGERWLQIHIHPLLHASGGAVVTHLDITQQKRTELAGAHDINLIAHRNRVSALGELATSLAHEVNQPLSAILSNTEVLKGILEASRPDLRDAREVLGDVQNDGRRAAAVIREMRGLLRRNPSQQVNWLDLLEVARDTIRLVANDAARRKVKIETLLSSDSALCAIGRTQWQQVLLNLLSNALDAAETADEARRWIAVRSKLDAFNLIVEVEDSGTGLPRVRVDQVFEPFFTTKPDGLGVGLTISRSIVEAAGGKLDAQNSSHGGAIFRVCLPVRIKNPSPDREAPAASSPEKTAPTIALP